MPAFPDAPEFNEGEPVSAGKLNQIVQMVLAALPAGAGMFRTGSFVAHRRINAGIDIIQVAVTADVPAATWDPAANNGAGELTNMRGDSPILTSGSGPDKYSFQKTVTTGWVNGMTTGVTIPAGKWRVGYVVDDVLIQVDCVDNALPTNYQ